MIFSMISVGSSSSPRDCSCTTAPAASPATVCESNAKVGTGAVSSCTSGAVCEGPTVDETWSRGEECAWVRRWSQLSATFTTLFMLCLPGIRKGYRAADQHKLIMEKK